MQTEFAEICRKAQPARRYYVSLYRTVPYYGGPEEGGWWGEDNELVATQEYRAQCQANVALKAIRKLAEQRSREARREYGEQCLREMDWLDARGLDDSFLREPDGEESYWCCVEYEPGSFASRGCRHYE